ncbi:MAG: helicase [Flavipsychrobacter sp.]|nr:helicase [Flavipsychrobacter sp.]
MKNPALNIVLSHLYRTIQIQIGFCVVILFVNNTVCLVYLSPNLCIAMKDTINARLEASRKELLDLGLRNPLLNYKIPKPRGLHIVQEQSVAIFDILVKHGKAMTFLARPGMDENAVTTLPELTQPELEESYHDTKLQTNETEQTLQTKLLNTYYFAKGSIEEQGVNILYLTLGMLFWMESGNTEDLRMAPLILIPVSLERSSAQERFRVRYTGSDIGVNLSLQAKMLADFNIVFPNLPEIEDLSISQYINDIASKIQKQAGWKIDIDNIELGFFSFGKFMIYHDLDSQKWPEDSQPADHPLLQSLLDQGFLEAQPTATEEHHLDHETIAHELFQVVDADSSQVLAMLAVHEGRNMVIQGPPGTGKSQTITNIIANAIGHGKKVLFVAEKMAALEVVKRRLDSVNLGEACLELHSHKANKKEFHEELKRVLELGKPTLAHLEQEVLLLDDNKNELNAYCDAINESIKKSGISAQKVIGFLLQIAGQNVQDHLKNIPVPDIAGWDKEKMNRAEAMTERIQARLKDIGVPSALAFWGSSLTVLLPHEQEALRNLLKDEGKSIEEVFSIVSETATSVGILAPATLDETLHLLNWLKLAANSPDLSGIDLQNNSWLLRKEDIKELLENGPALAGIREKYQDILTPEAWQQDGPAEIRRNIDAHGSKWYRFLIGAYKTSNKILTGLCKGPLPSDFSTKIQYVDAILEAKQLEMRFKEHESLASQLFGSQWEKLKSDWNTLITVNTYLQQIHGQIREGSIPKVVLSYLSKHNLPADTKKIIETINDRIQQQESLMQQVLEKLQIDQTVRFQTKLEQQPFKEQMLHIQTMIDRFPEIHQAIAWNTLKETAVKDNMEFLMDVSTDWQHAGTLLKTSLQKTWYEYLIEQALITHPALRKFERTSHEAVLAKFKSLDLLQQQYNRAKIALKHWHGIPRQEAGGQVNILKNEFNKKSRHMPIRKLMQEAGMAIQAIKPVLMMSPLSIANFIPPGSIEFDLIIFDEASQVRPVEAIGAILRGKQLVVVGDTKQLPPTSFFDKMNTDTDDEENVTADIQSILGLCDGQGAPQRMLRWHYRSRHESLISLSNHEFYENRLVIFPSPGSKSRMGLVYHHLEHTVYDRGKTRTNPKEAETVANAVVEHAMTNPKNSLGVVAFSTAQMQAIQNALEIKRRQHPEIESFFRCHTHEPFFVKNLENVQGDERDVIYISIGYGRTEDGKVPMSFGPLNNEGGERRLNVLITRAKLRCEVFTNITSEDIKSTATSKFGLRALKSFLYFAQYGKFNVEEGSLIPIKRPFEDVIAETLTSHGFSLRKQVGSSGFYIDLAIVDTESPGRYILGIECDGDAYISARSARDRDRLRWQVLEGIGWNMYRIWSIDWYRNPEKELKLLIGAIEKAKERVVLYDVEVEETQKELNNLLREHTVDIEVLLPVYQFATLPSEVALQELPLHSPGKLSIWIEDIVRVEGPVHFDEVARRMIEAAGVTKVGSRIKQMLLQASSYAVQANRIEQRGDFLWHTTMETPVIRDRSNLPATSKKIQYISPEELSLGVKKIVESAIAIECEAAIPLVARLFGFSRATEEMRKHILNVIHSSVEQEIIVIDGSLLKGISQSKN